MKWQEEKDKALQRLEKNGADEDIKELIEKINGFDAFFTTSSCSGRIALICIPQIGAKREAEFSGKWHRTVNKNELLEAIKGKGKNKGEIWFITQSPILHVAANNLKNATVLLKVANAAGFKYSGIKAISTEKVMVEICSTERMDIPLGKDGSLFCTQTHLDFILATANFMLLRGKEKLNRLFYGLDTMF
jgi:tRNA wybutosine-synthesizing protein 3